MKTSQARNILMWGAADSLQALCFKFTFDSHVCILAQLWFNIYFVYSSCHFCMQMQSE